MIPNTSGKAHGGTAVIVRNDIKHYLHGQVNKEYIQTTPLQFKLAATTSSCQQYMCLRDTI